MSTGGEVHLPELGVGITYSSKLEPLFEESPHLFDVIEVEPQTMWLETRNSRQPYVLPDAILQKVARLPFRKLVHSVGVPVGGSVPPNPAQLTLLRKTIERLDSPWASDHLSFNSTAEFHTGFFLPPRQTPAGVTTIVASIASLANALPVPIAVETGVSYLRPRTDELPDGAFIASVIERADCGLLLDLHNIFANAANGRQPVEEFLAQIPFERVWEVHIAGGMEMDGFWLDAHSGRIPAPLCKIAEQVIPRLPNLKAIIFEIFPSFIEQVGLDAIGEEMERLRALWNLRGQSVIPAHIPKDPAIEHVWPLQPQPGETSVAAPELWEQTLGNLVIGRIIDSPLAAELSSDPGVTLVARLIQEFRASMIVNIFRLSARFLMLALTPDGLRMILNDFWSKHPPHQFAVTEADAFAAYLRKLELNLPALYSLLAFEQAAIATLTDNQTRVVQFDMDPLPLLRALAAGRMPDQPGTPGQFEIELTADGPAGSIGFDLEAFEQVIPFH